MNEETDLSLDTDVSPAADAREGREAERDPSPPVPDSLEATGLSVPFVSNLLLKTLYQSGATSGRGLSESIRLPFGLLDGVLLELQQRHHIEVGRTEGHGRAGYVFDLTREGRERAREALSISRYVGPAPVPFELYVDWVEKQSVSDRVVTPSEMDEALDHLVLDQELLDAVGPAVNSGGSLFLYGAPGNGKTAIARALSSLFSDPIYVPYAVSVEGGTIIQVHDPLFHRPFEADGSEEGESAGSILEPVPGHDQRFALVQRPSVTVGGDLTMDQLDLQEDLQAGVYRAPLQVKANGGIFLLDDFGRQRIPARDLLNRWMVPLEDGRDYLALPTGHKLPVPFDCFLIFATNLKPDDLVEEAFLRRLRYKVNVPAPTRDEYETIFRRACDARDLEYRSDAVDRVYSVYYSEHGIEPRGCHPRDLVAHVCDEARYRGVSAELTAETIGRACRSYFLGPSSGGRSVDESAGPDRLRRT